MTEQTSPFGLRLPHDLKVAIQEEASRNNRSMNSEIINQLSGGLSQPSEERVADTADSLIYKAPQTENTSRRVYVLPVELVQRIHAYGYANGHQSEVSAVRELLDAALSSREGKHV